ncbi:MAG: hypothetical protein H8D67_05730 [Deltaproteobacteria bacterium]|nr:hypothetical protein [Deltaproteobacteria bacterium]MBL7176539.1 hypothetical protein [Desulfobacteraceae bacterium]
MSFRKIQSGAERIGISERTLWTWIKDGLPYYLVKRTAFVKDSDVDGYIARHRATPAEDIDRIILEIQEGK